MRAAPVFANPRAPGRAAARLVRLDSSRTRRWLLEIGVDRVTFRPVESFAFSQCACVLFERVPALADVERAFERWTVAGKSKASDGDDGWAVSGPGLILALPDGSFALADLVARAWPDDPAVAAAPGLAAAFRAGMFGPGTTPGALKRAADQSWAWPEGASAAGRHGGLVRLRMGYGRPQGAPADYQGGQDPIYELALLTEISRSLVGMKGALGFFVPSGEALRSREQVEAAMARKAGRSPPPVDMWSNIRAVALLEEEGERWLLVDMVGMGQLGLPDHEAIFADGKEEPGAVQGLLRNACMHVLSGRPIPPGSTSDDGAGRRWTASFAHGIVAPRREVVRWLPEQSPRPSQGLLEKLTANAAPGR
jgi:uncharacterized protein DUF4261